MSGVSIEQAVALLRDRASKIPRERVFFTLRKIRANFVKDTTVDLVRMCICLHDHKIPITAPLISKLLSEEHATNVTTRLHLLGDKNILQLTRPETLGAYGTYRWILSEVFLNKWEGTS